MARLGQSEDVAYKRVGAARLMLQFPAIYELLVQGRIHLTGLMLLKPHLTEANHHDWLSAASGKSKRQIEKLIATRHPLPDVPSTIRKLPKRKAQEVISRELTSEPSPESAPPRCIEQSDTLAQSATSTVDMSRPEMTRSEAPERSDVTFDTSRSEVAQPRLRQSCTGQLGVMAQPRTATSRVPEAAATSRIAPLSSQSYRVVFTASERLKQKLDQARELLSHAIAPTDLAAILERALDQLIECEQRRRYGVHAKRRDKNCPVSEEAAAEVRDTQQRELHGPCQIQALGTNHPQDPDPSLGISGKPRSRYVSAAVRREVWARDAGQCTFVDSAGRRCEQRHFLELDHCEAFARGGSGSVENLRLRCHAHNALEAERLFGRAQIDGAIAQARQERAG